MSLFWQELKKIWRPGILVGIVLLGLIYYYMFPSFYIEHFSNGAYAQDEFGLSVEWVAQYGPTLEPEERAELDSRLAEEIAIFDRQLEEIPEAAAVGVTGYDSFQIFSSQHDHDEIEIQSRPSSICWSVMMPQGIISGSTAILSSTQQRSRSKYWR